MKYISTEQLLEQTHRIEAFDWSIKVADALVKKHAQPSGFLAIGGRPLPAPRIVLFINAAK